MSANSTDPLAGLIPPPTEVNDTHKVYSVASACIAMCVVACFTVITRLGLRIRKRDLGADDYAIIPATLLYVGWTVLAVYMNLNAGVGKPLWEITLDEYSLWFKGIVVSMWLYPIMSAAIRVSTLLFYRRIFGKSSKTMRTIIWVLLGLQGAYVIAFSVAPAFVCNPYYYAWMPLERAKHCSDTYYANSQAVLYGVSMFFDSVLLVLPIFPVMKLHMSVGKRIGIAVIFALGAGASVAAAYKLGIYVDQERFYIPTDLFWLSHLMSRFVPGQFDQYGTTFWIPSQVEPTVALIGTSMPAFRQIFRHTFQMLSTRKSSKNTNSKDKYFSHPFQRSSGAQRSESSMVGIRQEEMADHGVSLDTLDRSHAGASRGRD